MTHPGVGPLTALATVLVLGPVTRFPTSKHVVSYIGLAPAVAASAAKCRLAHITKQGNTVASSHRVRFSFTTPRRFNPAHKEL